MKSMGTLEDILDNIGCGICVSSLEDGSILFTNEKFRRFFRTNIPQK